MKKYLSIILVIITVLCLFACGGNAYNKAVSQLESYGLERYDYDYKQISKIESDLKKFNIEIDGKITKITHLIKKEGDIINYAYVYEFENRDDASLFYEGYAKNSISRLKVNVVIFGNVQMINSIKF
ncbi:MAG: hypothetical protein II984_07430 [Clostridia bacterium]|nr:hypothetical protein [Clostridia bacterium]